MRIIVVSRDEAEKLRGLLEGTAIVDDFPPLVCAADIEGAKAQELERWEEEREPQPEPVKGKRTRPRNVRRPVRNYATRRN